MEMGRKGLKKKKKNLTNIKPSDSWLILIEYIKNQFKYE
jgi:hypothetical protein